MTKDNLQAVLQAIGDLSSEGVLLFSLKERHLDYVNDALIKMFDITHNTFRHEPAFYINHVLSDEMEYLAREFEKLLRDRKNENVEFMVMHHDGTIKKYFLQLLPA